MSFYISANDHQQIKLKSNYREFSFLYSSSISISILYYQLGIDINDTLYVTHFSGNPIKVSLYPKTPNIELLSNWTNDEYLQFIQLLKQHNSINGLDNKL